jgi:hypothetical protein
MSLPSGPELGKMFLWKALVFALILYKISETMVHQIDVRF